MYKAMYMAEGNVKQVRMFLVVGPRGASGGTWADLSYKYLVALRVAGIRPRAIPIGGMALPAVTKTHREMAHWRQVEDAFVGAMVPRVNVVCCPIGLMLGAPQSARSLGIDDESGQRAGIRGARGEKSTIANAIVYQPSTAIATYWTAGMVNIAITGRIDGIGPGEPGEDLACLKARQYDLVLCPSVDDAQWLEDQDITATQISPPSFAVDVKNMPCLAKVVDA